MHQVGYVEDYKKRLIQFASPFEIPEEMLMAAFVKGLDKRIHTELLVLDPPSLSKAMD